MPPCGSDLLLLTWRVTRPFSAHCFVPHRPHGYRYGLSDLAPAPPSIPLSPSRNLWQAPLLLVAIPGGRDLVSAHSKSIPTIRGPGEQVNRDLDSTLWGSLTSG
ncbi:unnamed protein product, partial [Staurois parvus]